MIAEDFKTIFEQLPGDFIVLTPELDPTVLYTTLAHLRTVKIPREDFINRKMFDIFPDVSGSQRKVKDCLKRVLENRQICKSEILRYDIPINGSDKFQTKYWTLDYSPVLDENKNVKFIIQQSTDITNLISLGFNPK